MRSDSRDPYAIGSRCPLRPGPGGGALPDELDHRIHDLVALAEIDLYAEVLSAVAASDRRLTDDELDAALGLRRASAACGSRTSHVG